LNYLFMPQKELERLQAVNRFLKLEVSKEKEIQEIVELAAEICQTPTAFMTRNTLNLKLDVTLKQPRGRMLFAIMSLNNMRS
jgi:hypothetical protein